MKTNLSDHVAAVVGQVFVENTTGEESALRDLAIWFERQNERNKGRMLKAMRDIVSTMEKS